MKMQGTWAIVAALAIGFGITSVALARHGAPHGGGGGGGKGGNPHFGKVSAEVSSQGALVVTFKEVALDGPLDVDYELSADVSVLFFCSGGGGLGIGGTTELVYQSSAFGIENVDVENGRVKDTITINYNSGSATQPGSACYLPSVWDDVAIYYNKILIEDMNNMVEKSAKSVWGAL